MSVSRPTPARARAAAWTVPSAPQPGNGLPRAESGKPPGADDYLKAFPDDTGKVRHTAPPTNPPQQALEKATKKKKRQMAAQGES